MGYIRSTELIHLKYEIRSRAYKIHNKKQQINWIELQKGKKCSIKDTAQGKLYLSGEKN